MQTFKHKKALPMDAMFYIDFLDGYCNSDSSPFDNFMGYDTNGNSMRLDEHLFSFINSNKAAGLLHFNDFFDKSFTDLLEPAEVQRLLLDLIMFSKNFPGVIEFLMIDERHQPVFLIK